MSESLQEPAPVDDNPFVAFAVANVASFNEATVSVPTPAVAEADGLLDDFLASPPDSDLPSGNVVAVVGEYGTGKSHLLGELLFRARKKARPEKLRAVYLEAQPAPFVDLYKRFTEQLSQNDVRDRVREFYADVVADALAGSAFTAEVAGLLRSGELDPVEAADRLGLMESRHLGQLQRNLAKVTHNAAFGTALTLLLRPGFTDAAWEWLTGHKPDQVLVDRGIDTAIATEEAALEAMGVFALLYSHRGRRFVLAIDEFSKVVSANRKPTENAIDAFEKMLKVFAGARAFLVLAGLPEYLEVLGENVRQRIGRVITISPLTAEQTMEFIRQAQKRQQLRPFDEDTVRYLVKLADGNPRRIVRLCRNLYRHALDTARDPAQARVTEAMVRQVARSLSGAGTIDVVRNEIRQVLAGLGHEYQRDRVLNPETDSRADYWISVNGDDSGLALLLTESVLDSTECASLINRATYIQAAAERIETVLVVIGLVHADLMDNLASAFSVEPIIYDQWTFHDLLVKELNRRVLELENASDTDPLVAMRERVGRVGRQQANTQRMLEQLTVALTGMRTASDRRLGQLQRELADLAVTIRTGDVVKPGAAPMPLRLPAEVGQLFSSAQQSLDALDQVDAALRTTFASAEGDLTQAIDARVNIRSRLRSQTVFQAMGVSSMLHRLLDAFRDGINEWYRSYVPNPAGQPYQNDRERLSALCRAYDAIYEYIPLFRLEGLDEFTPHVVEGDTSAVLSPTRLADAREMFNELSTRVQTAVLESVAGR